MKRRTKGGRPWQRRILELSLIQQTERWKLAEVADWQEFTILRVEAEDSPRNPRDVRVYKDRWGGPVA